MRSSRRGKNLTEALFGAVGLVVALVLTFVAVTYTIPTEASESGSASTPTTKQLQIKIQNLFSTVQQLTARLDALKGGASGSTVEFTFTENLHIGSKGLAVLKLQKALNASADTRVAETGAGSPGHETEYYGARTAAAVSRFQEKYQSAVLAPFHLSSGTGYFGSASRAKLNALLNANTAGSSDQVVSGNETATNPSSSDNQNTPYSWLPSAPSAPTIPPPGA